MAIQDSTKPRYLDPDFGLSQLTSEERAEIRQSFMALAEGFGMLIGKVCAGYIAFGESFAEVVSESLASSERASLNRDTT